MTAEVIDYDPFTGMTTSYEWDQPSKTFTLQTSQDAQGFIEIATKLRNDESIKKKGIKNNWMHACIVPDGVMAKMFKPPYNFNPYAKENGKKLLKAIQRDFPYLMTATGKYA